MKLKPCPFCGGEVKTCDVPVDANTISHQFNCSNCGMVAYFDYLDEEESIEAWNRRHIIKTKPKGNTNDRWLEEAWSDGYVHRR